MRSSGSTTKNDIDHIDFFPTHIQLAVHFISFHGAFSAFLALKQSTPIIVVIPSHKVIMKLTNHFFSFADLIKSDFAYFLLSHLDWVSWGVLDGEGECPKVEPEGSPQASV